MALRFCKSGCESFYTRLTSVEWQGRLGLGTERYRSMAVVNGQLFSSFM